MTRAWLFAGSTAVAALLILIAWPSGSPPEGERPRTESAARDAGAAPPTSGAASPAASEIAELRRRLDEETRVRRELERRLESLEREVAAFKSAGESRLVAETAAVSSGAGDDMAAAGEARRDWFDEQALITSGMDEARAREMRLFFEQLELERLRLRDRAAREAWDGTRRQSEFGLLEERETGLRERLGEDEYAAYLYAAGRPNRVEVTSVLASAPAGQAGMRAGDRVLRYANERIYSPRELRAATAGGEFGELVEVEVERDGETLRLYLPRGPMGVRTGSLSLAP